MNLPIVWRPQVITIGELFAGIGGFSLAFHEAGARTAWFVEKEPFCQQVLQKNFPGVPVYGDIYECHELPYVDVITAGFPCQPFSLAGKRQGVNDERYLVPEMLRVIEEVAPHVVLFENVAGFTNIANGHTFREFLRALAQIGYDAEWTNIRAGDIGAPHQRERWFCVAYAFGNGNEHSGQGRALHHGNGNSTPEEQRRNLKQHGVISHGQGVVYAEYTRFQGRQPQDGHRNKTATTCLSSSPQSWRKSQPRVGRNAPGLPDRLDGHQWPARPGQAQFDYEPPRVVSGQPNRAQRLKALGNAVVPQVVYPIACEIVAWLETQAEEGAA